MRLHLTTARAFRSALCARSGVKRVEKIDCGTAKFRTWEEIRQEFDSRFPR